MHDSLLAPEVYLVRHMASKIGRAFFLQRIDAFLRLVRIVVKSQGLHVDDVGGGGDGVREQLFKIGPLRENILVIVHVFSLLDGECGG